jgi:hypothetical protein
MSNIARLKSNYRSLDKLNIRLRTSCFAKVTGGSYPTEIIEAGA